MSTERLTDRVLRALHRDHGAEPPAKWQQRKSAQTRERLVVAGTDCLVEGGYAALTTAAVAVRCGLSRGAMHHHFATRRELVAAVVEHVFYTRMRSFLADYLIAAEGHGPGELVRIATEIHWQSVQSREYAAFVELAVAARTDPELAALFLPAARHFDDVWRLEMIEAFPQWRELWNGFKLVNDFVSTAHMGMLLHRPAFGDGERMEALRRHVAETAQGIFEAASSKPAAQPDRSRK